MWLNVIQIKGSTDLKIKQIKVIWKSTACLKIFILVSCYHEDKNDRVSILLVLSI